MDSLKNNSTLSLTIISDLRLTKPCIFDYILVKPHGLLKNTIISNKNKHLRDILKNILMKAEINFPYLALNKTLLWKHNTNLSCHWLVSNYPF